MPDYTLRFQYQPIKNLRITSKFGPRNTGIPGASTYHKGIDCVGTPAKYGDDLILVDDAELILSTWNEYRGWYCIFKINEDYKVLYQHMVSKCGLALNKQYPAGKVIGGMGKSCNPNKIKGMAAHLHFELWFKDNPINPEPYVQKENLMTLKELKYKFDGLDRKSPAIMYKGENYVRLRSIQDADPYHQFTVDYINREVRVDIKDRK